MEFPFKGNHFSNARIVADGLDVAKPALAATFHRGGLRKPFFLAIGIEKSFNGHAIPAQNIALVNRLKKRPYFINRIRR